MPTASPERTRTTARGTATRERILETAVDLLLTHGYSGLRIATICERADVAPTSLYWHFGSKAGLMNAIIERTSGDHLDRIREASALGAGPAERLDALIASIRDLVLTQPLGSLTGVALVSEGQHATPELLDALRSARRVELEVISEDLAAELGDRATYAGALATMIIAIANYAAIIYRIDPDELEVDRILGALREALSLLAGSA